MKAISRLQTQAISLVHLLLLVTELSLIPSVLANSRIIRYVYSKSSQCLSLHALICSQCLLAVCTGSATAAVCPHSPLPNSSRELCCSYLNLFYSWGESFCKSLLSQIVSTRVKGNKVLKHNFCNRFQEFNHFLDKVVVHARVFVMVTPF